MSARQLTAFLCMTTLIWSGLLSAALAQSPAAVSSVPICRLERGSRSEAGQPNAMVAVEVRLIRVPESLLDRVGVDFHRDVPQGDKAKASAVAFLNDAQVFQLVEALNGDRRASLMQAPKLTLDDRQSSTLTIGETQHYVTGLDVRWTGENLMFQPHNEERFLGLKLQLQPSVSADRRFVRLNFKAEDSILVSGMVPLSPVTVMLSPVLQDGTKDKPVPFTQYLQQPRISTIAVETIVTLPDGGTALFFGGKHVGEAPDQFGPPVLSTLPYVNRLFKGVRKTQDMECELFMVTPRIFINEEEEAAAVSGEANQPR